MAARSAVYVESGFCQTAETLREQFENNILASTNGNGGMTGLMYAFCPDRYQFLTAGADRVFTRDALESLLDSLRIWAGDALGVCHVSTPQARIYVRGCGRALLRDDVKATWHYLLPLTRIPKAKKTCCIKILTENIQGHTTSRVGLGRLTSLELKFNQLLVHDTTSRYSIEGGNTSMNPLDGNIFLDGYIW